MKWGESARSKNGGSRIRKPWLSDRKSANQSFKEDSMESYLSASPSRSPETPKSVAPPPPRDPTESTLEDESTSPEVLEYSSGMAHTPSPVQEVVKRLQSPSPLASPKVRKSFDIPELDVPVKAKASDYESGKLLLSSSPTASSDRVAQDLQQIIEEGMVMKKVETVEMTEQQILCKQLALAAAAVANRRSAEEAARRAAILAMEAAVERAAREEELRQEQEQQRQEELLRIQQQAEEELQRELRNRIAEAKAKAAQLQAESDERRAAAKTAELAVVGALAEGTLDTVPANESFQSQRTYHTVPEFNEEDDEEEEDEDEEIETCEVEETEVYEEPPPKIESPPKLQPKYDEEPLKMQSPQKVVAEDITAASLSGEIAPSAEVENRPMNLATLNSEPKLKEEPPMNDASRIGNALENEAMRLKAHPDESPTVPTVAEDEEEEEEVVEEKHQTNRSPVVLKHAPISGMTSDFLEEELHVEEHVPFSAHHSMNPVMTHMPPPVAVIANSVSFDQRSYQDDVSNFSNDDSSALQHSGHNPSHKMFQKNASQPSPRRSISDIIRHDLWNKDEAVVEQALKQLAEKASIHGSYRNAIARAGGILAIVRAMEQNTNHVGTQIAACQALEKLALDTENELAIGEVGGIEAILSAMMAHYTNGLVQEAAWAALWNCTCGNACDTMTIDTTQGGMTAIVSCMKQHVENPAVQVSACNTLLNLCLDNTERLQALVEADGLVAISQAMQTHWKNPTVRNEACYVLSSLLEKNTKQHMMQQQQESVDAVEQYEEVEVFEEEFL